MTVEIAMGRALRRAKLVQRVQERALSTPAALLDVRGIGPVKAERWGDAILDVIAAPVSHDEPMDEPPELEAA